MGGGRVQEIRVARLFRPTYAEANVGHPSGFAAGWERKFQGYGTTSVALAKLTWWIAIQV